MEFLPLPRQNTIAMKTYGIHGMMALMATFGLALGGLQAQEVGIGTTAPTTRLDVQAPASYANDLFQIVRGTDTFVIVKNNGKIGWGTSTPHHQVHGFTPTGRFILQVETKDSVGVDGVSGFQTATPSGRVWMLSHGAGRPLVRFGKTLGGWNELVSIAEPGATVPAKGFIIGTKDAHPLVFGTYNAERARIDTLGRMGIGTQNPIARLHVANDGMIYASGLYNSGDTVPDGPHTAFIWNPRKAAIRVGRATGTQWNNANIGNYSVGFGYNPSARGIGATVSGGYGNAADTNYATVGGGYRAKAYGIASTVAGGAVNIAFGDYNTIGGGRYDTTRGTYSTVGGGYRNRAGLHSTAHYATVGGGQSNTAGEYGSTVSGGAQNQALALYATVGGGLLNSVSGIYGTVGGGSRNYATVSATVAGGYFDTASGSYSAVGGGYYNLAGGYSATVSGGYRNRAEGNYGAVGGGNHNTATGYASVVSGGYKDTASGFASVVSGGYLNVATNSYSVVSGGARNTASGSHSVVGGGDTNTASGYVSTVGGGVNNTASGNYSTVSGGARNTASGYGSFVGGGWRDTSSGYYSVVVGGYQNTASGNYSFVGSGDYNTASGNSSFIGGGFLNTASGGASFIGNGFYNVASGFASVILGGEYDTASGYYSFAGGRGLYARSYGEVVLGLYNTDYTPNSTTAWNAADRLLVVGNGTSVSNRSDAMVILKNGNIGIGNSTPSRDLTLGSVEAIRMSGRNNIAVEADIYFKDQGSIAAEANQFVFIDANNTTTNSFFSVRTNSEVPAGSQVLLHVTETGRVGINTATPARPLHVKSGGGRAGIRIEDTTSGPGWGSLIEFRNTNGPAPANKNHFKIINYKNSTENYLEFRSDQDNGAIAVPNILVLTHSGNVGIGTHTPSRKLHVTAAMRLEPMSSPPASPSTGDMYMDDGTNTSNGSPKLMVYDGTTWQECW